MRQKMLLRGKFVLRVVTSRQLIRMVCLSFALLCLALGAPNEVQAQETSSQKGARSTITAAIPQEWPPYYTMDENGDSTGFAIDLFDAIATRAGYNVSYTVFPTIANAIDAGAKGLADTLPNLGDIPSRREAFNFTPPVQTFRVAIFVRKEMQNIRGFADLAGRRVAVVAGNVGRRLIKQSPSARPIEYESIRQALFELLAGSVDALIYPEPVVLNLARQARVGDRIETTGAALLEVKRAIAVHPSRVELHRHLSAAVSEFVGSPEYQKIYIKWFAQPEPYWSVERVLWWVAGLLVFITAGFLILHYRSVMRMNLSLETRVAERTTELQRAQEGLLRAERLSTLGEITGTVAHELRNPLGTIMTSFEIIRNKATGAKLDVDDTLDRIQRNIDRCSGIIGDLLAYARPDNLRKEPIKLDAWLKQVVAEYEFPETIKVEIELKTEGQPIAGDREQIRRIMINLLDNASQAITQAGDEEGESPAGRIRIQSLKNPAGVEIAIIDDGPGIRPDDRMRILEPLFSTRPFGIGLGLPNVQKIVANHGGSLTIESEPGQGATVKIVLPLPENE